MCQLSPVPFHGDTIFCVNHNNQPYTPAKPIVENLGLGWASQSQKLNANRERWGVTIIVIPSDSGDQQTLCLPVRKLPAYLASINPKKVRPELRAKIELYQAESDDALWNYWMNGRAERAKSGSDAPLSTAASRAPLRSLVHAWAQVSGVSHSALWPQVRAHFQLSRIDDLPESWLPDALAFVQEKIDQCVKGLPNPAPVAELPPAPAPEERPLVYRDGKYYPMRRNKNHVVGPREKAMVDFWSFEYPRREEELEERFKKLLEGIDTAMGDTIHQAVAAIGRDADTMFSISCMLEGLYSAEDRAREAFKEALRLARLHMRMATSMATAMNR